MSNSKWRYQLSLEGMLGLALRLQGWRVVVLTTRSYWPGHRLLRCFGLTEFLYTEDIGLITDEAAVQAFIAEQVEKCVTVEDFKKLEFSGLRIGQHILSGSLRGAKKTDANFSAPEFRKMINQDARQAVSAIISAQKAFSLLSPEVVLINEANYAFNGCFVETAIAQGVNVIQFLQLFRDDGLLFKKLGLTSRRTHPNSLSRQTWNLVTSEPWTKAKELELHEEWAIRYGGVRFMQKRDQPDAKYVSREEIRRQLGISSERKVACVFSHVLWDTNLFYGEDLFEDFCHWLHETAKIAANTPNIDWIFKLHPANHWKTAMEGNGRENADLDVILRAMGDIPPHVHILEPRCGISTLSLFDAIDVGITVRGTVGMELPCFGKPIITAGTGRYSGLGFTVDPKSREEYFDKLTNLGNVSPLTENEVTLAKKYAHTVLLRRTWTMESFRSDFSSGYEKGGQMNWKLRPVPKRIRVQNQPDLDSFTNWVSRHDEDYLRD